MLIEDFIITVFCLIDDECKKIDGGHKVRTRGFEPKLSQQFHIEKVRARDL